LAARPRLLLVFSKNLFFVFLTLALITLVVIWTGFSLIQCLQRLWNKYLKNAFFAQIL